MALSANASHSLLYAELRHRQGHLALDVRFTLTQPWTVLFGSSGSGKTTILRSITGFVRPRQGRIVLRDETLLDTNAAIFVSPHRRPVRSAGQAARLFPGMSVRENLLYGIGSLRVTDEIMQAIIRCFRIETLLQKFPHQLSGGEQQRVSGARATLSAITSDALLLLDEPFAGLDLPLRDAIVPDLKELLTHWQTPVLSVTHNVSEAFLLGAEVMRLVEGRIVEQGSVEQVLAPERQRLAELLGG